MNISSIVTYLLFLSDLSFGTTDLDDDDDDAFDDELIVSFGFLLDAFVGCV
jgi:hypothetical protein